MSSFASLMEYAANVRLIPAASERGTRQGEERCAVREWEVCGMALTQGRKKELIN